MAYDQLQFQYPYHKPNDEISDMNTITHRVLQAQFDCVSVRHHLKYRTDMILGKNNHRPVFDVKWLQGLHRLYLLCALFQH